MRRFVISSMMILSTTTLSGCLSLRDDVKVPKSPADHKQQTENRQVLDPPSEAPVDVPDFPIPAGDEEPGSGSPYHPGAGKKQKTDVIPVPLQFQEQGPFRVEPSVKKAATPTGNSKEKVAPPPLLPGPPPISPIQQTEDPPLVKALREYLRDHPGQALDHLQKYSPDSQEMLALLLPMIVQQAKKKGQRPTPQELASTLQQLRQADLRLSPQAQLRLRNVNFCRLIDRFGFYQPIQGEAIFFAGTNGRPGQLVQVYVEVDNFQNRSIQDRPQGGMLFETALSIQLEIRDQQKRRVWLANRRVGPELSRAPRRDLFLNCFFHVPSNLPVGGRYELNIEVRDVTGQPIGANGHPQRNVQAHRIATHSLEFTARAPEWTTFRGRQKK